MYNDNDIISDLFPLKDSEKNLYTIENAIRIVGGLDGVGVRGFFLRLEREGLSIPRMDKYYLLLKNLLALEVDVENIRQDDVDKFFFWLRETKYKSWTKVGKWSLFKKFVRYMKFDVDISFYRIKRVDVPLDILTLEEVDTMVEYATSFRNMVFLSVLYESGCRVGELVVTNNNTPLIKRNIHFDEHGCVIMVHGKTGWRPIRLVRSSDMLKEYLKTLKDDGIVFSFSEQFANNKILKRIAKKTGLSKRVYPHLFRHSRATHLDDILSDDEKNVFFGWSKNSDMASKYTHKTFKDVEKKILKMNGIIV